MKLLKLTKTLFPAAMLLFSACVDTLDQSTEENAGPADNQEVINEMGGVAFSGLSNPGEAGLDISSLGNIPELSAGVSLPVGQSSARLSKTVADIEEVTEEIDTLNKAQGEVLFIKVTKALLYKQTERIWIKWDDKAQDEIEDNENIIRYKSVKEFHTGRVEQIDVKDLDGDGVVAGEPQYTGKAGLLISFTNAFGIVEVTTIDLTAGADKNFDTEEDNLILAMHWSKTNKDGKKLGEAKFSDVDGDGILVDRSKTTPSVVDLDLYEANNPLKPLVEYSQLNMRLEVREDFEKDGKIIRISGEEKFKNGRVNRIRVVNSKGEDIIKDNDTVNVTITSDFPVTDKFMLSSEALFVIEVGSGLQNEDDNLVHEIHLIHEKRIGKVRKAELHFTTDNPVPSGEKPKNGKVDIKVDFRNGKTWTLSGTFDEGSLEAVITGPEGNTLDVKWNRDGEVIAAPEF